jgi:hypothetical protein
LRKETWRERWNTQFAGFHFLALFIRMLLDIDHVLQEDERLTRWVSPEDEARAA